MQRQRAFWIGALCISIGVIAGWELRPREARGVAPSQVAGDGPPTGSMCEVFLRRDYIATYINGETSGIELQTGDNFLWRKTVRGSLVKMNDQWVVIQRDENRHDWIPRKAVVAIEVTGG